MTNDEIDMVEAALLDLLKIGSVAYPSLALAAPLIAIWLKFQFHKLRIGIADGSIVSDGMGGLVPAHGQSIYDPITGIFTGRKT